MKLRPYSLLTALGLAATVPLPDLAAEVIINEIGAASSERQLRSHPDGRPRLGWGPSWSEFEFDDSDWKVGTAPFGYGNDGVATDVGDTMDGRTPSLYLRQTFTVSAEDAARDEPFRLSAAADSGFVAFLNGHEIARGNLGRLNGFVFSDQSTFASADENKKLRYDSVVLASECLREGENIFAVQVQNEVPRQINERDPGEDNSLKFEGTLTLGLGIFAGGSNISMPLADDGWRYRVGYTEPSGGLVDWAHAEHPDVEAGFSDWVELHNNGAEEVDLTGWSLTDDQEIADLWKFPEGTKIAAGGYLVVLTDGNTAVPGDYMHASFGLASAGEFLGLSNGAGEFVSQFEDGYPKQNSFHSYGVSEGAEDGFAYFSNPTPGAANGGVESMGAVKKPKFEPGGGIYDETVELTITSNTEEAVIHFTLDGSEPTATHGTVYEGPITIEAIDNKTGTPVRARAFKDGMIDSNDATQTYLVGVDEVFKGIPTVSFVAEDGYAFYAPHGITTVEGGTGLGNDWRSTSAEDYYMPDMHGRPFERKISMEVIYAEDNTNVQIDAGLRLAASAWSRGRFALRQTHQSPWQSSPAEKPSFNMFFRNDYGDDTLNFPLVDNYPVRAFRQLRFRAGKNDITNPWITDELSRRLMADTGQLGSVGINTALFINGVYKGYFNAVARLREELFQDLYGSNQPWQVKHIDVWADGSPYQDDLLRDTPEWDHLEELLAADLTVKENYDLVLAELDPVNFADYFIVNIYGATWDWPHNNLVIARELSEEGRWRGYMWDAEGMFGVAGGHGLTYDTIRSDLKNKKGTTPSDDLATIWNGLMKSPEWRLTFADRLQKHFFTPGGALTQENMTRRLEELEADVGPLMDFAGPTINTNAIKNWINGREKVLFTSGKQFEKEDLWGEVQVPNFAPRGGAIDAGTTMKISVGSLFSPQSGDIYYTTDGSDPRLVGGLPNPNAILYDRNANTGIVIDTTTPIKARVLAKTLFDPVGKWSALQDAEFRVGLERATADNLLISEIMSAPAKPNEAEDAAEFSTSNFEFMEFYNPTDVMVDLGELRFTAGIDYIFDEGDATTIGPKSYGVIVNDRAAFAMRYGEGIAILGEYNKKLKNGGEHLEVSNGSYEPIIGVTYSNDAPWPENAESEGHSLVRLDLAVDAEANDPTNWGLSAAIGGSPGRAEGAAPPDPQPSGGYDSWKDEVFTAADAGNEAISGLNADPDGDGSINLAEFAFGTSPMDANSKVGVAADIRSLDGQEYLAITVTQRVADDVSYTLESSQDLEAWATVNDLQELGSAAAGEGLKTVTYRSVGTAAAGASYVRWRVEAK